MTAAHGEEFPARLRRYNSDPLAVYRVNKKMAAGTDIKPPRQILVYPGTYDCDNGGDLAMLQVAVKRLKQLWPEASVKVLTRAGEGLIRHCPETEAVPFRGQKRWVQAGGVLPRWIFPALRPQAYSRFPVQRGNLVSLCRLLYPPDYRLARQFVAAMFNADLFVLAGCGVINDEFPGSTLHILGTFEIALRYGIPAVMLSQGLGPVRQKTLVEHLRKVLPRVNAIFLRENKAALPLLEHLNVSKSKIVFTGDDAIELAFNEKPARRGTCLGINLRIASYSRMDQPVLEQIRQVILKMTREQSLPLVGIPIKWADADSDVATLKSLLSPAPGKEAVTAIPANPQEVIKLVSQCRVVVAGSYHAGVFALSQGIPVVGLVRSDYYADKFSGLADQFGSGCVVLYTDADGFAEQLSAAIGRLWQQAEALRPGLLEAAERLVQAARDAYASLPDLISRRDYELPYPEGRPVLPVTGATISG